MRILSLLPAATEIVYLLGLEKYLVGVSHECDYPPQVNKIPKITSSSISNQMTSLEIDKAVKNSKHTGTGVFHINEKLLKKLNPNLILTQELCEVCAIGFNEVKKAARILTPFPSVILSPQGEGSLTDVSFSSNKLRDSSLIAQNDNLTIVSLEPESIEDVLENIKTIGEFTDKKKKAIRVVKELNKRLEYIKQRLPRLARNDKKPKVLVVEWLEPVMIAGHWVPEMVAKAGGEMLITSPGEKSPSIDLTKVKLNPDILIISPCGFDIRRTLQERKVIKKIIQNFTNAKIYLVDGNSYMTRPGSRIIDGIEILSEIFYPKIFPRKHTNKDWLLYQSSLRGGRRSE